MSDTAPALSVGQQVEITHTFKMRGSVSRGEIVYVGTIDKLFGGPLSGVTFTEDSTLYDKATPFIVKVVDQEFFDVTVRVLGWRENTVAYIDIAEDGNPDHVDEKDVMVIYRGSAWQEVSGKFRHFWRDEHKIVNVRPVHDGQVPR